MSKTSFVFRCFLMALVCSCSVKQEQVENKPKNFIIILVDDFGWPELGVYGNTFYETPNLDRWANQSIIFTNGYAAAPVCSPTRASIMTGKSPAELQLTDYLPGNDWPHAYLKTPDYKRWLPLEEKTIAEYFKEAGYATGHYGKWHLSKEKLGEESYPYNPDKQGFDSVFVTHKPYYYGTDTTDLHNTRSITDGALAFMEKHQNDPFFLYVSHNSTHSPFIEDSTLVNKYMGKQGYDKRENNPIIAAMIETLDTQTGRIFDTLDSLGIAENTVVTFLADNGRLNRWLGTGLTEWDGASSPPLRDGKAYVYEGGIRSPYIMRVPKSNLNGTKLEYSVSSYDLLPTYLDMAGIEYDLNLEGKNIFSLPENRPLFFHYPHYHVDGGKPMSAMIKGNFKVIVKWQEKLAEKPYLELYNLDKDIGETNNRVEAQPDLSMKMEKELMDWLNKVNAQLPEKNENFDKDKWFTSRSNHYYSSKELPFLDL